MKKFLAAVLAVVMTLGIVVIGSNAAYDEELVVSYRLGMPTSVGILYGPETLEYRTRSLPEFPVTRILPFMDTDNASVLQAYDLGIVHGDGDGNFRPLDTLTQAELAQMAYNAFATASEKNAQYTYYWADKDGAFQPETGWYTKAMHWVEDYAIYPNYDDFADALKSDLWQVYCPKLLEAVDTNGYGAALDAWAGTSASYDWIVTMIYLIYASAENEASITETFRYDALAWAAERGCGPKDAWRHVSSGDYITRAEACELFIQLCELS